MLCDKDNETDYLVALVHCNGDGVGRVVCGSNKRSLVNNALAIMGKDIDDLQQEQARFRADLWVFSVLAMGSSPILSARHLAKRCSSS